VDDRNRHQCAQLDEGREGQVAHAHRWWSLRVVRYPASVVSTLVNGFNHLIIKTRNRRERDCSDPGSMDANEKARRGYNRVLATTLPCYMQQSFAYLL